MLGALLKELPLLKLKMLMEDSSFSKVTSSVQVVT